MKKPVTLILFCCLFFFISCQISEKNNIYNFGFEKYDKVSYKPLDWIDCGKGSDISIDPSTVFEGNYSLKIEKSDVSGFGCYAYTIPVNFEGNEIGLTAFLKLQNVNNGFAGISLQIDGDEGVLEHDNMMDKNLHGTSDWEKYAIDLKLPDNATKIHIGAYLTGEGNIWVDDFKLRIDNKDINQISPKSKTTKPEFDFSEDSGVNLENLGEVNVKNAVVLGQIWGFLKYHHPKVMKGDFDWDYELFMIMQNVYDAKNRNERNLILHDWIEGFGLVENYRVEDTLQQGKVKLNPNFSWINSEEISNYPVAEELKKINLKKSQGPQSYVTLVPGARNPIFKNENDYKNLKYPDPGFRLLALYRFWNIIQYFYPYFYLIEDDWNEVLYEFVPKFINASNELEYKLVLLELMSKVQDSHVQIIGNDKTLGQFWGTKMAPLELRFIDEKLVITKILEPSVTNDMDIKIGDQITKVDGVGVDEILGQRLNYVPGSNRQTKLRDIARKIIRSNKEKMDLTLERTTDNWEIELNLVDLSFQYQRGLESHKWIQEDIGYIYPGKLQQGEIGDIMEKFLDTKGLIVDLRCYPSDFIVFSLSKYLMDKPKDFVKFTHANLNKPGLFTFTEPLSVGEINNNSYKGKVIIIIDETTQSQAEYTAMALRVAPDALVVGGNSAGADGNVSEVLLPGGIVTYITGIGVYYPDGTETQRIGIVPDIMIKPTIEGIRKGIDEPLRKAIELINEKKK